MRRYLYIISDLHLGGAGPEDLLADAEIGFQMCPPEARRRLASFIRWISDEHPREITELIINGDFIDYLAEEPIGSFTLDQSSKSRRFEAFTLDSQQAVAKFYRAVERTDGGAPIGEQVFEALRAFVVRGHCLTILLGNHDLELSLPDVRRALSDLITQGRPAQLQFVYDGEAYVRGNLLVEHGNRYDGWNAVAHGYLRAHRSALSRGEPVSDIFNPPPGSRLVAEIMNPLKARFKFIDLLKPENEALIPVLAALDPKTIPFMRNIVNVLGLATQAVITEPRSGSIPQDVMHISECNSTIRPPTPGTLASVYGDTISGETIDSSRALLAQVDADWFEGPSQEMHIAEGALPLAEKVRGAWALITQVLPFTHPTYERLRRALVSYRVTLGSTFDLSTEAPRYLDAAIRLSQGRRTVVFGHTHLAKRIALPDQGLYLNTGTWCPIIRMPTDSYDVTQADERVYMELKRFVEDLAKNRIEKWCVLRTTFAKVVEDGEKIEADLFEFRQDGSVIRL